MQTNNDNVFSEVEWDKIDNKKAEFIYYEGVARLDDIHRNIDIITNKALSMLSFSVPIMTALIGFFILQWGKTSVSLIATSICALIFLFAIIVLLLFVLIPRGLNTAQGEPKAYLSANYYQNTMENIFKGNMQTLQKYITEDMAILNQRGNLFKATVVIFSFFPVIAAGVWVVFSLVEKC